MPDQEINAINSLPSCPNCGFDLKDEYRFCPKCGQTRKSLRISLSSLIKQSLGDLFSYDSKFWHSLIPLIIKPGFLTHEYLKGKRVRYIPPVRLYIFISLIYFIFMGINLESGDLKIESKPANENLVEVFQDSLQSQVIDNDSDNNTTYLHFGESKISLDTFNVWIAEGREAQLVDTLGLKHTRLNEYAVRFFVHKSVKAFEEPGYWIRQLVTAVSYLMFVMMPLMAIFLMLLFYKNRNYFTEHLIHAFHLHSFIFFCLILFLFMPSGVKTYYTVLLAAIIPFYLFVSLRNVYDRKWLATLSRLLFLLVSGFFAMIFLMVGSFFLSFLFF